jgi:hypothetical protein
MDRVSAVEPRCGDPVISVDNHKPTVEVWTPYWRTNRIARVQFRTQDEQQAAQRRADRLRAARE